MMRLIDADKLKLNVLDWQDCYNGYSDTYDKAMIIDEIEEAPTIDAEPVIRCKDCYFCGEIDENGWHCCENLGVGMPKNGFCSDAERREDVKVN